MGYLNNDPSFKKYKYIILTTKLRFRDTVWK